MMETVAVSKGDTFYKFVCFYFHLCVYFQTLEMLECTKKNNDTEFLPPLHTEWKQDLLGNVFVMPHAEKPALFWLGSSVKSE